MIMTYIWWYSAFLLSFSLDCSSFLISESLSISVIASMSSDCFNLHQIFRPCVVSSSDCSVSIGGRTSSNQYLASNSDPSDDAITSKMNVMLLPLAVFLTFPTILIACCIFHTDCTGSPLRSTSTGNSYTFYHLSSYMLSSALLLGTVTLFTISLATCCHQLFYWEQQHFLPSL